MLAISQPQWSYAVLASAFHTAGKCIQMLWQWHKISSLVFKFQNELMLTALTQSSCKQLMVHSAYDDGSDIQGRSQDITQPLGSLGCLWKLRMINGMYHHSHLSGSLTIAKIIQYTQVNDEAWLFRALVPVISEVNQSLVKITLQIFSSYM